MIAETLGGALVAYVVWTLVSLELNCQKARAMKVPVLRVLVDPHDPLWLLLEPHLWRLLDCLPIQWSTWPSCIRYTRRGWHFRDKTEAHRRLGHVWAYVTPKSINIHVSESNAVHEILTRRLDFLRPIKDLQILALYGQNISTTDWRNWPRHRKTMAAPFNESIMKFVWTESMRQTDEMLRTWTGASATGIPSVSKDIRTLSLNVLAATGFRRSYEFRSSTEQTGGEAQNYRDALQTVLDHIILLLLVPYHLLLKPWVPASWARVGRAAANFRRYMEEMLEEESSALRSGEPGSGGLMTSFVRALDVNEKQSEADGAKSNGQRTKGLTVDEIFGNIFVINFAGHDTTANTLAFSMLLLSAHPHVQGWVAEELSQTSDLNADGTNYLEVFSKLKRCRAVLLETLRLFPPVMAIPKIIGEQSQPLTVDGHTIQIVPGTSVTVSLMSIHTDPKVWPDPLVWRPQRWIVPGETDTGISDEAIFTPSKATYFPWSEGPYVCPGLKFAQVEFAAVLARLLQSHRIEVILEQGEDWAQAQRRAERVANDVNMEMLLRMQNPDRARLVCKKV